VGEWASQSLQGFLPTTIRLDGSEIVHLSVGPLLKQQVHCTEEEFWAHLHSWGGEWLWDHTYLPFGIDPLVEAIADGTAVLVTDGSYSRKIRHNIDGAGWLIYCRRQKSAGSYRCELLGLLAVHLMVLAVDCGEVL
jgi:hypothetical protein